MLLNFLQKARRAWLVGVCLACCWLAGCTSQQNEYAVDTPDGIARMGDITQTHYVIGSNRINAKLTLHPPASAVVHNPVDILILFDRTASMRDFIKTTASAAEEIVHAIQHDAPNTRFAVASVSDYSPLFTSEPDTRTWLLNTDFTIQSKPVVDAFANIQLTNGGDFPEAYSRGMFEASQLDWRPDAKKIIVFFGDSTDHPVDPGRDETLGTADDLTMTSVLAQLKAKSISVIAIHTRNNAEVVEQFQAISQATAGRTIPLEDASSTSQVIKDALRDALVKPANLVGVGEHATWATSQVEVDKGSDTIEYRVEIHIPEGTAPGVYPLEMVLTSENSDDAYAQAFQGKPFVIKVITGWYNHPLVLWLPLLVFLAYLAWCSWRMLGGGYKHAIAVTSSARFDPNRYTLSYMAIDLLALSSAICVLTALHLCWNGLVLSQLLNTLFR